MQGMAHLLFLGDSTILSDPDVSQLPLLHCLIQSHAQTQLTKPENISYSKKESFMKWPKGMVSKKDGIHNEALCLKSQI